MSKYALASTLLHTLEFLVVVGVAVVLIKVLNVDSETAGIAIAAVLAALAKFARASDSVPLPDFVGRGD